MAKSIRSKRSDVAKTASTDGLPPTADYRHAGATRKNLPEAAMAGEADVPPKARVKYAYSPHLDPVLRFDPTGRADKVQGIVERACAGERLSSEEQEILRAVGKNWEQPWLEWANKQEEHARGHFSVDPVALHIHERISAQAILRTAQREDTERSLFAQPEQSYSEALKFYKHDVDWANRLILGDSLQVMSSLAHRENLAGKVQMIYIDPPYGIKFASNFQPEVGRKDVKEKSEGLTREPEMVRAYRDTWHLGTSSYLQYLIARFRLIRELLTPSGSAFVQISDVNEHRVRALLDEVFGSSNFVCHIAFRKAPGQTSDTPAAVTDYLLWYCKDRLKLSVHPAWRSRDSREVSNLYGLRDEAGEPIGAATMQSASASTSTTFPFTVEGQTFSPPGGNRGWRTNRCGMQRLHAANRLMPIGKTLTFIRRPSDFGVTAVTSLWTDTMESTFATERLYAVQTAARVIQRCILLTTRPGDLVIDPTCGSGTTAFVAEQWGRRWITIDTSRVALSIARQRLLTAKFDHYRTAAGPQNALGAENPGSGFKYKTIPHITLGAIAQNQNLDPIFAKHEPILAAKLKASNDALASVPAALRAKLKEKLAAKEKSEGKKSITDADRRRWILPPDNRDPKEKWTVDAKFSGWYDWEVPFDTDPEWPKPLQDAVTAYRAAWRAKMDEVDKCISDNADQEELVDQPEVVKGVVRVSGPFTVEGVIPEELSLTEDGTVTDFTPNEFDPEYAEDAEKIRQQNHIAYISRMAKKLRMDGVTFPNNKRMTFSNVECLAGEEAGAVHARGTEDGKSDATVGIVFGPEFGPVSARLVETALRRAKYYDDIVIAGFAFDPEATAEIENFASSGRSQARVHLAHIRPELNSSMNGLLREDTKGSNQQYFTVFGLPSVRLDSEPDDAFTVTLEGVDIFNPISVTLESTKAEKVSAWFLDSDYDGRCFCACQAFFPNKDAWEKIAKALGSAADPEAFATFNGLTSLPFKAGKHRRIAVKAVDARGNEVMTVKDLRTEASPKGHQ